MADNIAGYNRDNKNYSSYKPNYNSNVTDTATGGNGSYFNNARIDKVEEFDFDNEIVKPNASNGQRDKFTNYDISDARDKDEIPNYLNYLREKGLVDIDDNQYRQIISCSYDEAMELINDACEEMAFPKALYYNEKIGVPITDEFVKILQLPNAENTPRYSQYMNEHFNEFKETYLHYQIDERLLLTEEQNSTINGINTLDDMNEYLGSIYMEASFRYDSDIQAKAEYEKRCFALTGYTVDELLSGNVEDELQKTINDMLRNYDDSTDSEAQLMNNINSIQKKIANCQKIREAINDRKEFLLQSYLLKSSDELDSVSLHGELEGNNEFKIYYGSMEITDFDPNTNIVKYRTYDTNKQDWVIESDNINNLNIYGNWEIYQMFDLDANDGKILSAENMNDLALAKYYLDAKKSSDYKDQLFCYALEHDEAHFGSLFSGVNNTSSLVTLVETMSDEELRIYNKYYSEKGSKEANEYLDDLMSGMDFQDRLAKAIAIDSIERFADVKQVDYNELNELSVEVVQKMYEDAESNNTAVNIITNVDEEGNIHYYSGKDKVIYISKLENGKEVYYEASVNDWPSIINYCTIACDGFGDGLGGFVEGIDKLFSESDGEYSVGEKANMLVQQAYSLYEGGSTVYGVSSGVGRAVPSMVISMVPGGGYVSVAANWMSRVGSTKDQTVNRGYTTEQAWKYAIASGSVDTVVDVFAKNIPGLNKVLGHANKYWATSVLKSAFGASGGYVGDLVLADWILNEDFSENFNWETMERTALNSALVTGILNSYKIPNDVRAVKDAYNSYRYSSNTITNFMEKYDLSRKDARMANKLLKSGYNEDEVIKIINLTKQNVDGVSISRSDAIDLFKIGSLLKLKDTDLVEIYRINRNSELSLEECAFINGLMKSKGISFAEASFAYQNIKVYNVDENDAFRLAALQKIGVDVDFDRLDDQNYIKDLLAIGELAVFSDIDSVNSLIDSGEITSEQVTQFFKKIVGDQFDDWIKDDSKVGYILYANFKKSTERAGLTPDQALKNVDLLRAMIGYYSDARDNLNKPTDLKSFRDAYVFNKQASHFDTYRTHGVIHVLDVYNMSMETYSEFAKVKSGLDYETIAIAAMMHDTGMSGKFEMVSDENGKIIWKDMARTTKDDVLSVGRWRGQHSANSGRIILENADLLREFGYNDLQIAEASILAFVHSKSNSGVKTLTDNDNGWSFAINALAESNKDFDLLGVLKDNGKITGLSGASELQIGKTGKPDTYTFKYAGYSFDADWIEKMAYEGLIVRIGDALTNNDNGLTNQYGDIIHIDYENYSNQLSIDQSLKSLDIKKIDASIFDKDTLESLADKESAGIKYTIGDGKRAKEMETSQKFVLGEDNQTYGIRTNPETGGIEVVISVKKANDIPFCTLFAINERLGELDSRGAGIFSPSSKNNLSLVIEFNETPNSDVRTLYENFGSALSSKTPIIINYP